MYQHKVIDINPTLTRALEESEAIYWSKYYNINAILPCYANVICGAFVGAIPQVDILAMNRVIGLGMQKTVTPEHIDEIIHFYEKAGSKRFFIQLSPYVLQADIQDMLLNRGFRYLNNWVKLVKKADQKLPVVKTNLKVVEVGPKEANIYGRVIYESFDWEDHRLQDWLAGTVGQPGYRHYLAVADDQPVAAAALHITGVYASMAFAGTLPDYRGLGAQSLLLKTRILEAIKSGCQYIISETAEPKPDKPVMSHRNMQRLGFEEAYLRENWIWEF